MELLKDIGHVVTDVVHGENHAEHVKQRNVQKGHGGHVHSHEGHDHNLAENPEKNEIHAETMKALSQKYKSIKPASQFRAGPLLRFQDIDVNAKQWHGSVLIVTGSTEPPRLLINDPTKTSGHEAITPRLLDTWDGINFYRYDIHLLLMPDHEKRIEYWFETEFGRHVDNSQKWHFFVPALDQPFNWAFYSCNGFSNDVDETKKRDLHGPNPMWDDLLASHDTKPFHAIVGGGDQIYNDGVLGLDDMQTWLEAKEEERLATKFDDALQYIVERFYFEQYVNHFSTGTYSKALSLIPSVNVWDDHDILDGYGSYPPKWQNCSIMKGIGAVASRFYLLFQQHAGLNSTDKAGLLTPQSGKGWNTIVHFGKHTLAVLPDARSERTVGRILSEDTYKFLEEKISEAIRKAGTIRHLVIVLGTPLVYPSMELAESTLGKMTDLLQRRGPLDLVFSKSMLFKKVSGSLVGDFGAELMDDLVDSWAANAHFGEKKELVEMLQGFAVNNNVRVTFVGGDVHVGGAGRLYGNDSNDSNDARRDPYHMYQIISSAIVNAPPENAVLHALHRFKDKFPVGDHAQQEMIHIFHRDVDGSQPNHQSLINRRNWCEVRELPDLVLEFNLHVEHVTHRAKTYTITVDPLEHK